MASPGGRLVPNSSLVERRRMASPGGRFVGRRKEVKKSNFSVTCSLLGRYLKEKGRFGDLGRVIDSSVDARALPETTKSIDLLRGGVDSSCEQSSKNVVTTTTLPDLNSTLPMQFSPQNGHFKPPFATNEDVKKQVPQPSQMTVFYGGKVLVFDNFPPNKANELVAMAKEGNNDNLIPMANKGTDVSPALQNPSIFFTDHLNCPPPQISFSGKNTIITTTVNSTAVQRHVNVQLSSDLPIARRVSLNRFLEKRKGRINSKAPYQVDSPDLPSHSCETSSSGKQEEDHTFASSSGELPGKNPEQTTSLSALTRQDPTAQTPAFWKLEEQKPWLGLATSSSYVMPEIETRR